MSSDRTFYGGEPITGARGGELSAGRYQGPETEAHAPWKCPACGVQNERPLKFGCEHCGAGQPGYHVGNPPPAAQASFDRVKADVRAVLEPDPVTGESPTAIERFALWLQRQDNPIFHVAENEGILRAAFVAGWVAAFGQLMPAATPVTADVERLAPAGKVRRTIIAALEIFRDQILSQQPEEIASGEWCSVAEVEQIIAGMREEDR